MRTYTRLELVKLIGPPAVSANVSEPQGYYVELKAPQDEPSQPRLRQYMLWYCTDTADPQMSCYATGDATSDTWRLLHACDRHASEIH